MHLTVPTVCAFKFHLASLGNSCLKNLMLASKYNPAVKC